MRAQTVTASSLAGLAVCIRALLAKSASSAIASPAVWARRRSGSHVQAGWMEEACSSQQVARQSCQAEGVCQCPTQKAISELPGNAQSACGAAVVLLDPQHGWHHVVQPLPQLLEDTGTAAGTLSRADALHIAALLTCHACALTTLAPVTTSPPPHSGRTLHQAASQTPCTHTHTVQGPICGGGGV